ncbi:hypothetical protein ACO34A_24130 (plasmid) [Rhizobium sp. ACO-34A]|nr:amidohydrolase family protein [Rhizobium sp. ACO-34A]ATN36868.1 hypothetical protein ACO34A_24130 [Rhizobium sp. ACO-34A]
MMALTRRRLMATSIAALAVELPARAQDNASSFVIDDARVIDGSGGFPLESARIVVADGMIAAVGPMSSVTAPSNATVISASSCSVIPGLVSGHVHVGGYDGLTMGPPAQNEANILRQLGVYLDYGVTTVASMGTNSAVVYSLRGKLQNGSARGADIFVADHGLGVPKGAPPAPLGTDQLDRPATPNEAREAVRAAAARGTNFIKLWLDDFQMLKLVKMQPEIYRAAIDEAHKAGLPVYVHIHYLDDAKDVLRAGADVLAHGVRDKPIDDEFVSLMKANGAWYIPTLSVDDAFFLFAEQPQVLNDPFVSKALHPDLLAQFSANEWRSKQINSSALPFWKRALAINQQNTKAALGQALNVGFGTDSGAMPLRVPGFAEHRELELLVDAGITPSQALMLATSKAAETLGLTDRGMIAPGKKADLVLLDGNPLEDIRVTRKIRTVWKSGAIV